MIGIYEPVIVLGACEQRQTSAAAEPQLSQHAGAHYHRACYPASERDGTKHD